MSKHSDSNRRLNVASLFVSLIVFGTGLILFFQFHVGHGAHQETWLGVSKVVWLNVHQVAAIVFIFCFATHLQKHWKYISSVAKRWRRKALSGKIWTKTREQIVLLAMGLIVTIAGFFAWAAMPGATLQFNVYHRLIDVHNIAGLIFLIGISIHIWRRRGRISFRPAGTQHCSQKSKG